VTGPLAAERRVAWLLAAPGAALLLAFVVLPFVVSLGLSVTDAQLASPLAPRFSGIDRYLDLAGDPAFWRAAGNNLLFALLAVPLQTVVALALALLVNHELRGVRVFRTLLFLPVVFPLSLVAVVWVLLFAPGPEGPVNALLEAVTFGAWQPADFLRHPWFALPAIIVTSIWQGTGFQMVVLLAGLQGIPEVLYDIARVDGATAWQRFRHVTLPQLRNPLVFVVIVTTILSSRAFDQVRIMTRGGPGDASTTLIYESVRWAFDRGDVARGAAVTVVFFVLVLGVTAGLRRLLRHEESG
jgi:multiple sugar transport system permease protein